MIEPPPGPARANPRTKCALRWTRLTQWSVLTMCVAVPGLVGYLVVHAVEGGSADTTALMAVALVVLIVGAVGVLVCVLWILACEVWWRRYLGLPWQTLEVDVRSGPRGTRLHTVDTGDRRGVEIPFRSWVPVDGGESMPVVWFAGDPTRSGLPSRPGGRDLRQVGRVLVPRDLQVPEPTPRAPDRGRLNDLSYPSPRRLRRTVAYILDSGVHAGSAVGIAVLTRVIDVPTGESRYSAASALGLFGIFLTASFADRVVGQSFWHTTVGKAVCGLVIVDPRTGGNPGFRRLLGAWLWSGTWPLWLLEIGPDEPTDYLMPAVRTRDLPDPKVPPAPIRAQDERGASTNRDRPRGTPPPSPPDSPAVEWPPTRKAHRRYIAASVLLPSTVIVLAAVGLWIVSRTAESATPGEWIIKLVLAPAFLIVLIGITMATVEGKQLRNKWISCSVTRIGSPDKPFVSLSAVDDGRTMLITSASSADRVITADTEFVWFAGHSRYRGVIAPVGGTRLCYVTDQVSTQTLVEHSDTTVSDEESRSDRGDSG